MIGARLGVPPLSLYSIPNYFTLFVWLNLAKHGQYLGEDLEAYVKRFHEKALDCCDLVTEDVMGDIYLHAIIEDYRIYFVSLSFSSFSRLIEAAGHANESIRKASRPSSIRCTPKMRLMSMVVERNTR